MSDLVGNQLVGFLMQRPNSILSHVGMKPPFHGENNILLFKDTIRGGGGGGKGAKLPYMLIAVSHASSIFQTRFLNSYSFFFS